MSSEWERGIDENPLYASSMGKLEKMINGQYIH
jgi:hypothetical protein